MWIWVLFQQHDINICQEGKENVTSVVELQCRSNQRVPKCKIITIYAYQGNLPMLGTKSSSNSKREIRIYVDNVKTIQNLSDSQLSTMIFQKPGFNDDIKSNQVKSNHQESGSSCQQRAVRSRPISLRWIGDFRGSSVVADTICASIPSVNVVGTVLQQQSKNVLTLCGQALFSSQHTHDQLCMYCTYNYCVPTTLPSYFELQYLCYPSLLALQK